jgi:hypothetical protein
LYYKDLIGNISSSNTVHTTKQVRNQAAAAAAAASAIWQQQQQSLGFPLQQQPRAAELQAHVPSTDIALATVHGVDSLQRTVAVCRHRDTRAPPYLLGITAAQLPARPVTPVFFYIVCAADKH